MTTAETAAAADTWSLFVQCCLQDPELASYMQLVLSLAGSVLGNPEQNVALLERISDHYHFAKEGSIPT